MEGPGCCAMCCLESSVYGFSRIESWILFDVSYQRSRSDLLTLFKWSIGDLKEICGVWTLFLIYERSVDTVFFGSIRDLWELDLCTVGEQGEICCWADTLCGVQVDWEWDQVYWSCVLFDNMDIDYDIGINCMTLIMIVILCIFWVN